MLTFDSSTLTTSLTECLTHLQMLEDCYMVLNKFKTEFKALIQNLNICFTGLIKNANLIVSTSCKNKLLLCLSQISKSLKLFADLLHKPLFRQGVWYLCERLRWCLSELRRMCCSPEVSEDNDSDAGCFLRRVELALQLLETRGSAVARDTSWSPLINDIICQAVTIAKIATEMDYNEITSACQGILEVNSHLTNEDTLNSNQLSLMADSMFNSLISLEERVNVAILRLVLQVFSEPCRPVKLLVKQCGQAPPSRSLADLDPLVAELDAHIERVILIGQFAVSCCDDTARVRGMKCCLASVESIDSYLVPALKALYLTPGCEDKRLFARLLCDHWQHEATTLYSHLDNIIDSTAFSRVVQESVSDLSSRGSEDEATEEICKQTWLLYKHLTPTGVDLAQLKQSIWECEAAINKRAPHPAVVKRMRLVVAAVDKVAEALAKTQMSQHQLSADKTNSDSSPMGTSLRDLPLDISLSSTKSHYASYRPQWLQKKICEAKKNLVIRKEATKPTNDITTEPLRESPLESAVTPKHQPVRTVYLTPKTTVKGKSDLLTPFLSRTTERNTTLYMRTPRRVVQNQIMDASPAQDISWSSISSSPPHSLALEISDILDNLSVLADTLSSSKEAEATNWQQPQPSPPADVLKRYFSGSSFDSQWFSLASVRTEEVSADVDTPERMHDLKLLDDKIRNLKTS